jgi:hypothetical protein
LRSQRSGGSQTCPSASTINGRQLCDMRLSSAGAPCAVKRTARCAAAPTRGSTPERVGLSLRRRSE